MKISQSILDKNSYRTRDLYFASVLYALDTKLINLTRDGRICWFEFEDKEHCLEVYRRFISKDLLVNAKAYEEAVRTLKDLIFE